MPKNKIQKGEIIRDFNEKVKKAKSLIFAGFNALGVKDNENLRAQLRQENSEYYVAKKTLMNRALQENNLDIKVRDFAGQVAAIFSYEDEVASAKIIGNFRKDKEKTEKIVFLGGVLEGKLLSKDEVEALSKLPSKSELYAQVVGSLNAPISGFVNVLAGSLRQLVYVLKAIEAKK
ncbi:TPA: 50S ribosomal protein L10 [Candidatus Falkowbacteria bacterium]|nr:MAG: 50S ribosomal protein L10 [Candidatus Falkowbacteria bacterium GW2011_GWF2_43_32]HBA36389.1 50S ribosomal protein L10 [Candidatus Falkowbacteria bacterium]